MANRPYPSFLIYLDKANLYRWRYQAAGNHKTLADSGESFTAAAAILLTERSNWPWAMDSSTSSPPASTIKSGSAKPHCGI